MLLLIVLLAVGADIERHPATIALLNVWEAARCGSPDNLLNNLETDTATGILNICDDYLEVLQSLSTIELSLLFWFMRFEATPGEVEYWDRRSVLEMIVSAPNHTYFFVNSILQIDSLKTDDTSALIYFTLRDPYGHRTSIVLPALLTEGGWRIAGLDTLLVSAIEDSFYN